MKIYNRQISDAIAYLTTHAQITAMLDRLAKYKVKSTFEVQHYSPHGYFVTLNSGIYRHNVISEKYTKADINWYDMGTTELIKVAFLPQNAHSVPVTSNFYHLTTHSDVALVIEAASAPIDLSLCTERETPNSFSHISEVYFLTGNSNKPGDARIDEQMNNFIVELKTLGVV